MRENMLTGPAPVMNTRGSRKQDRKDETTWDLLYQVVAGFSGTWWEEMTWQRPVTKLINGPRRMAKCRTARCGVAGIGSQEECVITTP